MLDRLCLLIVAMLLMPTGFASEPQARRQFDAIALETLWNRAHLESDVDVLARLWADDIVIIIPSMTPFDKSRALNMWSSVPVKFTRYDSSNVAVKLEGVLAVVTGTIVRARTFGDRTAEEHWIFTKVYRRSANTWRVILFQASPAPEE